MILATLTYPRLSNARVALKMSELLATSDPEPESNMSLNEAAWPAVTDRERASLEHLKQVREAVQELARHSGFPNPHSVSNIDEFDNELPELLGRHLKLDASEAAEPDVWAFLTLCVLPDVAKWRYPKAEKKDGAPNLRYERYLGGQRNVFRLAWTRHHMLGELSRKIGHDDFEAIRGREILDYRPLAKAVVSEHVARFDDPGYIRREGVRRACMLLLRWSRVYAFELMSVEDLRRICNEAFDTAWGPRPELADNPGDAPGEPTRPACVRARGGGAPLLPSRTDFYDVADLPKIGEAVDTHTARFSNDAERAARIRDICWEFIDAWPTLDDDARRVATRAISYYLEDHDQEPDYAPDGLADDLNICLEARATIFPAD